MYNTIINLVIVGLILFLTYALTSEGLWGAALMCFNVMFAGIIAFNFYEPLAALMAANMSMVAGHADSFCMMVIFIASLVLLRLTTETLAPALVRYPSALYQLGRLFFGFSASVMTVAIIVLSYEAAAVHKNIPAINYKSRPPFGMGIDHEWLAFMQWTTGWIFADYRGTPDPNKEFGTAKVFDPRGEWLLNHQDARPFGTENVLSMESGEGAAAPAPEGGGAPGSSQPGAPAADSGRKPGDPQMVGSGAAGVALPPP